MQGDSAVHKRANYGHLDQKEKENHLPGVYQGERGGFERVRLPGVKKNPVIGNYRLLFYMGEISRGGSEGPARMEEEFPGKKKRCLKGSHEVSRSGRLNDKKRLPPSQERGLSRLGWWGGRSKAV